MFENNTIIFRCYLLVYGGVRWKIAVEVFLWIVGRFVAQILWVKLEIPFLSCFATNEAKGSQNITEMSPKKSKTEPKN